MLNMSGKPIGGGGMSDVIAIKQRNQNVNVEQRTQSVRVLFPQSIDLLVGHQSASAFKRHEASNSGAS